MNKTIIYLLFSILLLSGCDYTKDKKTNRLESESKGTNLEIKYAKGFKVTDFGAYRLVDMQDPVGESSLTYHYAFVKKGENPTEIPKGYTIIQTPINKVVCMTALQISNFIKLNAADKIVGISSTRFLFNSIIKQQLKEKKTRKIGIEGNFDNELIMALNPEVILVSPFKKGGYESIRNLGFPLITFLGYKESSPLGQAEWLKFTGMLIGMEDEANRKFTEIEKKYNNLKRKVENVSYRPTVLSGEMHGDNWYVVGGNSYLANIFKDAGAKYFMTNDNESGGFYIDFEQVYLQGANVDFWRVVNSYDGNFSYDIMEKTDSRYADFKAFKNKKVIYCNLREKPFYENTPVEPEVVLADLIKAFHPEQLPTYKPVYYEILK